MSAKRPTSSASRKAVSRAAKPASAAAPTGSSLRPELRELILTTRPMIRFAEAFPDYRIVSTLWRQWAWSHFREMMYLKDELQHDFYAEKCRVEGWSVRMLREKIDGMLYERTALSKKPAELIRQELEALREEDRLSPDPVFKDPYFLDFLGLRDTYSERDLIGDEFFFVDLVSYHRILKCHVLINLQVDESKHEYLGQLNTYVNWFRKHEMAEGDGPPVGLLLCTRKNHALMEYALAGTDNQLFVSRHQLALQRREDLDCWRRNCGSGAPWMRAYDPRPQPAGQTPKGPVHRRARGNCSLVNRRR